MFLRIIIIAVIVEIILFHRWKNQRMRRSKEKNNRDRDRLRDRYINRNKIHKKCPREASVKINCRKINKAMGKAQYRTYFHWIKYIINKKIIRKYH